MRIENELADVACNLRAARDEFGEVRRSDMQCHFKLPSPAMGLISNIRPIDTGFKPDRRERQTGRHVCETDRMVAKAGGASFANISITVCRTSQGRTTDIFRGSGIFEIALNKIKKTLLHISHSLLFCCYWRKLLL
jgi:hypothetical protein